MLNHVPTSHTEGYSRYFEVSDVASVKEEGVAGHEDCVKEAVDACPVGAIEAE